MFSASAVLLTSAVVGRCRRWGGLRIFERKTTLYADRPLGSNAIQVGNEDNKDINIVEVMEIAKCSWVKVAQHFALWLERPVSFIYNLAKPTLKS